MRRAAPESSTKSTSASPHSTATRTTPNVILANNGDIVRLVGTDSTVGKAPTGGVLSPIGYLTYNYDVYGYPSATERIIPRTVTLLDNTPGGPDLAGQLGPLVTGTKATNGVGDIGGTPAPCNETRRRTDARPRASRSARRSTPKAATPSSTAAPPTTSSSAARRTTRSSSATATAGSPAAAANSASSAAAGAA